MNATKASLSRQIANAGYKRVKSDFAGAFVYEKALPGLLALVSQLVLYEEDENEFQPILFLVSYEAAEFSVRYEIFENRRKVEPIPPACLIGRQFVNSAAPDGERWGPFWTRWDGGFLSILGEYEQDFAGLLADNSNVGSLILGRSGANIVHQRDGLINYAIVSYLNGSQSLGNRLLMSFLDLAAKDPTWYGFESAAEVERVVRRITAHFEGDIYTRH